MHLRDFQAITFLFCEVALQRLAAKFVPSSFEATEGIIQHPPLGIVRFLVNELINRRRVHGLTRVSATAHLAHLTAPPCKRDKVICTSNHSGDVRIA